MFSKNMLVVGFPGQNIPTQEHYEEMVNTVLENIVFAH